MPRVSAGSAGPGYGCTCMSSLKPNQILSAMCRAAEVHVEYQKTESDGTLVFKTWTDPKNVYTTTFNPAKPGKVCKHAIRCAAYLVGDWLIEGFTQLRKEQQECLTVKKENQTLRKNLIAAARKMLETKPMTPSDM